MTTNKKNARSANGQGDDLEAIDDIGCAYAQALHRIGIFRYADLAQFTAAELSERLEQTGVKVRPCDRIETKRWIEQAKVLAEQVSGVQPPLAENSTRTLPETKALDDPPSEPKPNWRPFADFTVSFDIEESNVPSDEPPRLQTRVYNGHSGEELPFPGVEAPSWVDFILDHARAELPPEVQLPTARGSGASEEAAQTLEITDVRIEPGISTASERGGVLAFVSFHLSGPNAQALARDALPYQVELHSINTEDGTADFLGLKRGTLQPEQLDYECQLRFPMPRLGRYQLESIALLMTPKAMMACRHLGPTVKVVP